MVKIELNEFSPEDVKYIQQLKEMGLSDELIQIAYQNTQNARKSKNEIKKENNDGCS